MIPDTEEVTIEVPWGHIAGFTWGEKGPPVILVHGVVDNAASFIPLQQYLPSGFRYLVIDLPGHGKSSHLQQGFPISFLDLLYSTVIITRAWTKEKVIFIGHSLGARLCLGVAALYPEYVSKLFLIDGLIPEDRVQQKAHKYMKGYMERWDNLTSRQIGKKQPVYSIEEIVQRLLQNRPWPMEEKGAHLLAQRGTVPVESGFTLTVDQRFKLGVIQPYSPQQNMTLLSSVSCPVCVLISKGTLELPLKQRSYLLGFLAAEGFDFFDTLKNYDISFVEGNHNVHIDHPERVAPFVIKFLLPECSL